MMDQDSKLASELADQIELHGLETLKAAIADLDREREQR